MSGVGKYSYLSQGISKLTPLVARHHTAITIPECSSVLTMCLLFDMPDTEAKAMAKLQSAPSNAKPYDPASNADDPSDDSASEEGDEVESDTEDEGGDAPGADIPGGQGGKMRAPPAGPLPTDSPEVTALKNTILAYYNAKNKLTTQLATANTDKATLQATHATLQTNYNNLQKNYNTLQNSFDNANAKVAKLTTDLANANVCLVHHTGSHLSDKQLSVG